MTDIRRRTVTFGLAAAAVMPPRLARADSTKVTFVLTNDIYQMGETLMADGKRRGGFARLAAVVKAERAKGGHVVFAHGGDTLSPSLMSGIDQGAHIIALTNVLKPDIFVPGNHEFDFGKAVFSKAHGRGEVSGVCRQHDRGRTARPLAGIKDRDIVSFDGIRIGLTGAAHDNTPRMSNSEDLQFLPTVATMKAQAEALRRDGVDLVVVVMHADRKQGHDLVETHTADVILTGHNHDLFIDFDGRTLMVESSYDAHYVTVIDLHIETKQQGNKRSVEWWPQFRVVDTATVTPDPEIAAMVAGFQQELDRADERAADHHRGRARQPQCHRARPRGGDRQSHRRRDARARPRRRRDHERRRHPRRQGLRGRHRDHPPRRAGGIAVRQSSGDARTSRAASSVSPSRTACRGCPPRPGGFRRCPA